MHGCADELETLVRHARVSDVVLVGDLFTKGPDPAGVWAMVRDRGWRAVLGNHDERLIDIVDGRRQGDNAGERCVAILNAFDSGWLEWVRALPRWLELGETLVVHAAVHPSGDPDQTAPRTFTHLRRWPSDARRDVRWTEVYTGERPVVFGHDAVRGRFERWRNGRRHLVGLDSGCCYGGHLTGYVVGEDRFVSTAALRVYKEMREP